METRIRSSPPITLLPYIMGGCQRCQICHQDLGRLRGSLQILRGRYLDPPYSVLP